MPAVISLNSVLSNLEQQRGHKFALLLGAGISHSSGIPTTSEICNDLTKRVFLSARGERAERLPYVDLEEAIAWLKQQPWYQGKGDENDYSLLMRTYNQTEAARRKYLEGLMERKRPANGLLHLAIAIKNGVFDIVLTTNFDRLVEDALRIVDAKEPLVVDHEVRIDTMRLTDSHPKVIKLHGDFLYNPANLDAETSEVLVNMKTKLERVLTEYGLIVVGYSGNDKSVMSILGDLAKASGGIPYGLYWMRRTQDVLNPAITDLLDNCPNCFQCEIESSDQFFQAVTKHLALRVEILSARVDQTVAVQVETAKPAAGGVQPSARSFRLHDLAPAPFSEIDLNAVKQFLATSQTTLTTVTDNDAIKFLTDEGLVLQNGSSSQPTYGSLLLFGINPRRYVPSAFVKCAFFKSSDEIVQEELHGTVPKVIEGVLNFVTRYNEKTRDIRVVPVKDVFDFPPIAVREAVVNAIAHRDYADFDRPVSVFIHPDRLEIMSPGGLIPTVSKESLGKSPTNRGSRNITLHRVLNEMRYAEGLGTGIPRIIRLMQENRSPAPVFEVGESSFTVKLPKRDKTEAQKPRLASATDVSVLRTNLLRCSELPLWVDSADSDLSDYRDLQNRTQPAGVLASPYRGKIYFFGNEATLKSAISPFKLGLIERVSLNPATLARIRGPINDLFYQGIRRLLTSKGLRALPRNQFFFGGNAPRTTMMAGKLVEVIKRQGAFWLHEGVSLSLERFGDDYYLALLPRFFLTTDGQMIASNDVAKGVLTQINYRRYNNVVRDSVEAWGQFLGDGQQVVVPLITGDSETRLVFSDYAIVSRGRTR